MRPPTRSRKWLRCSIFSTRLLRPSRCMHAHVSSDDLALTGNMPTGTGLRHAGPSSEPPRTASHSLLHVDNIKDLITRAYYSIQKTRRTPLKSTNESSTRSPQKRLTTPNSWAFLHFFSFAIGSRHASKCSPSPVYSSWSIA